MISGRRLSNEAIAVFTLSQTELSTPSAAIAAASPWPTLTRLFTISAYGPGAVASSWNIISLSIIVLLSSMDAVNSILSHDAPSQGFPLLTGTGFAQPATFA